MSQLTEDVLFLKSLYQVLFVLIGNEIAAFGIVTDLQSIDHLGHGCLGTHHIPEVLGVLIGSTAGLNLGGSAGAAHGLAGDGSGNGLGEFGINCLTALHTLDFVGECCQLLFHASIGGIIFGRQYTLAVTMGIQETVHSGKQLSALIAHFDNSHDKLPPN